MSPNDARYLYGDTFPMLIQAIIVNPGLDTLHSTGKILETRCGFEGFPGPWLPRYLESSAPDLLVRTYMP